MRLVALKLTAKTRWVLKIYLGLHGKCSCKFSLFRSSRAYDATTHSMLSLRGSGLVLNNMYAFHLSTEEHIISLVALIIFAEHKLMTVQDILGITSSSRRSLLKCLQLLGIPLQKPAAQLTWSFKCQLRYDMPRLLRPQQAS